MATKTEKAKWKVGDTVRWHESDRHAHARATVVKVFKNGKVRCEFRGAMGVGYEEYTVRANEIVRF